VHKQTLLTSTPHLPPTAYTVVPLHPQRIQFITIVQAIINSPKNRVALEKKYLSHKYFICSQKLPVIDTRRYLHQMIVFSCHVIFSKQLPVACKIEKQNHVNHLLFRVDEQLCKTKSIATVLSFISQT